MGCFCFADYSQASLHLGCLSSVVTVLYNRCSTLNQSWPSLLIPVCPHVCDFMDLFLIQAKGLMNEVRKPLEQAMPSLDRLKSQVKSPISIPPYLWSQSTRIWPCLLLLYEQKCVALSVLFLSSTHLVWPFLQQQGVHLLSCLVRGRPDYAQWNFTGSLLRDQMSQSTLCLLQCHSETL